MAGERVTAKSDWFTMRDAALQILPLQEEMPFVIASQISPSGMTLAGKYGIGVISIGSMSTEGLTALPTQWGFAEDAAKKDGKTVSRKNWRVLLSWHIAETREKARGEAGAGPDALAQRIYRRHAAAAGAKPFTSVDEAVDKTAFVDGAAATIGTPDDLVKTIKNVIDDVRRARHHRRLRARLGQSGEHLPQLGHGRALRDPGDQRLSRPLRRSQKHVIENRELFERAGQAVMAKIMENEKAAAALAGHRPRPLRDPRRQRARPAEGSRQAQGVTKALPTRTMRSPGWSASVTRGPPATR